MPVIIPPGYAQVALQWESPNLVTGRGATVLGFGAPLGPDPLPLDEFCKQVFDAADANLLALLSNNVRLVGVYGQTATSSYFYNDVSLGNQAFQDPPPNVTMLISHSTLAKGRRGRGRTFLYGGVSEGEIDEGGNVDPTRVDSLQGAWDGFIADCVEVDTSFFVILQHTTPTGPAAPVNPTPPLPVPPVVSDTKVQGRVATQRRRLRR